VGPSLTFLSGNKSQTVSAMASVRIRNSPAYTTATWIALTMTPTSPYASLAAVFAFTMRSICGCGRGLSRAG
jgi:hypothetical protein